MVAQVLTSYQTRVDDLRLANLSLLSAEPDSPHHISRPVSSREGGAARAGADGDGTDGEAAATAAEKDAQLAASMRDMRCRRGPSSAACDTHSDPDSNPEAGTLRITPITSTSASCITAEQHWMVRRPAVPSAVVARAAPQSWWRLLTAAFAVRLQ